MPYIAQHPDLYLGRSFGSGECVAFVQAVSMAPNTGVWHAGVQVARAGQGTIAKGTVIATMVNGSYPNHAGGNHAAIYVSHDDLGLRVIDQWAGQRVHERVIRHRGGTGSPSNDADAYYVVE